MLTQQPNTRVRAHYNQLIRTLLHLMHSYDVTRHQTVLGDHLKIVCGNSPPPKKNVIDVDKMQHLCRILQLVQ